MRRVRGAGTEAPRTPSNSLRTENKRSTVFVFPPRSWMQSAHMPQGGAKQHKCFLCSESPSPRAVCRPDGIFKYSWAMWSQAKTPQRNHTERVEAELNLDDNSLWNNQDLWCLSPSPQLRGQQSSMLRHSSGQKTPTKNTLTSSSRRWDSVPLYSMSKQAAVLLKFIFHLGSCPPSFQEYTQTL